MSIKPIGFLWVGQTLANLGDILYLVALISLLYQVTESALFTSMVPILFVSAQLLSGIAAPLLFDRYDLKRILLVSQSLKTLLLVSIALYIQWMPNHIGVSIAFVFVFAIAIYAAFGASVCLMSFLTDRYGVQIAFILSAGFLVVQLLYLHFGRRTLSTDPHSRSASDQGMSSDS